MSADDQAAGQRASGRGERDWDAKTYDRISAPQQQWAAEQLARLRLRGDETVLDAGCGSGKVTALLVELVPRGKVYAVDVAPSMVEHTQQALGDRVTALCQDLTELSLPQQVDAIFSNATFHWVMDHDRLFRSLASVLKPGGQLVAQCGGHGNIDAFRRVSETVAREPEWAPYFQGWSGVWNYATAEETKARLERAGFVEVQTWLEPRATPIDDPESFVRTVCLVRHLDRLPTELHDRFVHACLERCDRPFVLDYVRLNMTARLAGDGS
ncbi:MAG TPA: methyltransferase domain-containing protein [Solirubrobacteraceae bacterium]|nr:methyltransferase domain-containing protein [Solirubrobacteraceae bacterium]